MKQDMISETALSLKLQRSVLTTFTSLNVWWTTNDDLNHADVTDLWGITTMTSTIKDDVTLVNTGHIIDPCPLIDDADKRPCKSCSVLKVLCNSQPAPSWHTSCSVTVEARSCFAEVVFAAQKLLCLYVLVILWKWRHVYRVRVLRTNPGIAFLCMLWGHASFQSSFFNSDQLIPPQMVHL